MSTGIIVATPFGVHSLMIRRIDAQRLREILRSIVPDTQGNLHHIVRLLKANLAQGDVDAWREKDRMQMGQTIWSLACRTSKTGIAIAACINTWLDQHTPSSSAVYDSILNQTHAEDAALSLFSQGG